jgi:predicted transcriptional regulator
VVSSLDAVRVDEDVDVAKDHTAARGVRGFSPIIEEAVRDYLERGNRDEAADDAFAAARGAWGLAEAERFEAELKDAWSTAPS